MNSIQVDWRGLVKTLVDIQLLLKAEKFFLRAEFLARAPRR
jgi:hypothetical protein